MHEFKENLHRESTCKWLQKFRKKNLVNIYSEGNTKHLYAQEFGDLGITLV